MRARRIGFTSLAVLIFITVLHGHATAAPEGTMTWGVHVTLASRWLDPAETEALVTPFLVLYALHDAVVKPMTGVVTGPSLAESWTMSRDGLVYDFVLRKNVRFHNGEPVTSEDVKFSFERYKGAAAKLLKDRVKEIQTPDPGRVRIVLKEPWPDFMTFYGTTASGAAWVVPKKYLEKVGEEGFKKAPIGAGPYRLVSFNPGVEMVERAAFLTAWREKKIPGVIMALVAPSGNAATRLEPFVTRDGFYSYSAIPEAEDLYARQSRELDRKKREAMLHQIQRLIHDRVTHAPLMESAFLWAIGPRVEEPGLSLIPGHAYSAPYEDVKLKRP